MSGPTICISTEKHLSYLSLISPKISEKVLAKEKLTSTRRYQ
jgi:hypothetical protein